MQVRVLFFGVLKDISGTSSEVVELRAGDSVRDLIAHYERQAPHLGHWLPSLALAVNQQYADPETRLNAGDEVALLPPVSGGAGSAADQASPKQSAELESRPGEAKLRARYASIVREPIDTQAALTRLKRAEDGAALVFEGVVRNQTRGRRTLYLDYEAYEAMALAQMESLAAQALSQFPIRDVALIHRVGRLEIGETSVVIAVVSAHRAAAFEACRWLIDTLKRTVPIWKKEHFADGAVWADGEPFPPEIARANCSAAGSPARDPASK